MNRKRWVIVGKAIVLFHIILFFIPFRLVGGLLIGVATGIEWVVRDWRELMVGIIVGWADASKPRREDEDF